MDKIKRNERLSAIARLLTDAPNRIHTLGQFCALFDAAKSTVSEDIDLVSESFRRFDLGKLETVPGGRRPGRAFAPSSAGSARAPSHSLPSASRAGQDAAGRLSLYLGRHQRADTAQLIGEILATQYYDRQPDLVLTMETKGIPSP